MSQTDKTHAERIRIFEQYEQTYETDVVNFVPGEICVVASARVGLNEAELYRLVAEKVNRRIATVLSRHGKSGGAMYSDDPDRVRWAAPADLRCPLLAERFHQTDPADRYNLLLPLDRADAVTRPTALLPRTGGTGSFVGFYQLDADVTVRCDPKDLAGRWRARRQYLMQLVSEAVRLINLSPNVRSGDRNGDLSILAATPNWLTVGAHNSGGNGCGSPGGIPRAISKGHAPEALSRLFRFADSTLGALDDQAQTISERQALGEPMPSSGVIVAVLDTSPTATDIKQAIASPHIADADKWLLRLVQEHVHLEGPLSAPTETFDHLSYLPNWHGPERDHAGYPSIDDFRMPDHGLFIAGTIYHLAPAAEIHLLRVLGDYGVGDLNTIVSTLAALPGHFLKPGDDRRLVVNLSLGAELPIVQKFPARWFPHTSLGNGPGDAAEIHSGMGEFRDLLHRALQEAIDSLIEQGVLVVAAVGNDHYIPPIGPKEPRYPAAYAKVVGVAAVQTNDVPADYTNLGDVFVPQIVNNAATFGGNATLPGGLPGNGPAMTDVSPNAVVGIFTAPVLPLNGEPNATGWVAWAGTSFATPIISAIAANLWADHRTGPGALDADGVVAALRALHAPGEGGRVPVLEVVAG